MPSRRTGGNVALIFALALGPLALLAFGGIQVSIVVSSRFKLQSHIDQIALNAAQLYVANPGANPSQISRLIEAQVAQELSQLAPTLSSIRSLAIEPTIKVRQKTVELRATGIFVPEWAGNMAYGDGRFEYGSTAEAKVEIRPICMLGDSATAAPGLAFLSDAWVTAEDCVVWTNATGLQAINFDGGGRLETERLCSAGRASAGARFVVIPEPEDYCTPVPDPLADRSFADPNPPCAGVSTGSFSESVQDKIVFTPGTFCNPLNLNATHVTFSPGVYVFERDFFISASHCIRGEDVVFIFNDTTSEANVTFSGPGFIDLMGPTSGPYAGFLFASARVGDGLKEFRIENNAATSLGGVTYLPDYNVTFSDGVEVSAASPVTTIIGESISVKNSSTLEVANNPDLAPYAPRIEIRDGWVRLIK